MIILSIILSLFTKHIIYKQTFVLNNQFALKIMSLIVKNSE